MNAEARIIEPGQLETPRGEIRYLFLPHRDLFSRRAERLRSLSKDHPLGDYLAFLAHLAEAQQEALNLFPATPLPGPDERKLCRERGAALLSARSWSRDPAWRTAFTTILWLMKEVALPSAAQETVAGLTQASEAVLENTADRISAGDMVAVSPQELPFVAAALQVYWVHMASSLLKEDLFNRLEQGGLCPVCGSQPSVGIVRGGGNEQGLRYLSCSLCSSQWHMVRLKCSSCESTSGIDYHILEGSNGAVKIESCGDCHTYLKLLYLGKDPQMEVMADDLATLPLDMLMNEAGMTRGGPNLMFHPGGCVDR